MIFGGPLDRMQFRHNDLQRAKDAHRKIIEWMIKTFPEVKRIIRWQQALRKKQTPANRKRILHRLRKAVRRIET